MAVGEVMRMEVPTGGDLTVSSPDLHVLAVDDSIVDRKVIERLLRISSCKGKLYTAPQQFSVSLFLSLCLIVSVFISVTTVENGTWALQYLGLDGNTGASDLKVQICLVTEKSSKERKRDLCIFCSCFLSEKINKIKRLLSN